jgi:hypothetical protein
MIEITIVGLKKIIVTWIFNPCYSYIITTSTKNVSTHNVNGLSIYQSFLLWFFQNQHLHIYPQKLKKKGYDNDKDKVKQT